LPQKFLLGDAVAFPASQVPTASIASIFKVLKHISERVRSRFGNLFTNRPWKN